MRLNMLFTNLDFGFTISLILEDFLKLKKS